MENLHLLHLRITFIQIFVFYSAKNGNLEDSMFDYKVLAESTSYQSVLARKKVNACNDNDQPSGEKKQKELRLVGVAVLCGFIL